LKARTALHEHTGHWFPFDVEAGLKAWEHVRQIPAGKDRFEKLKTLLPEPPFPLKAQVEGTPWEAYIVVKNEASYPVTISRHPTDVYYSCDTTGSGGFDGGLYDDKREAFVTLKPGEAIRTRAHFADRGKPDPHISDIRITYLKLGSKQKHGAWIGKVPVTFSPQWKTVNP
jgi:hypothetical protein